MTEEQKKLSEKYPNDPVCEKCGWIIYDRKNEIRHLRKYAKLNIDQAEASLPPTCDCNKRNEERKKSNDIFDKLRMTYSTDYTDLAEEN